MRLRRPRLRSVLKWSAIAAVLLVLLVAGGSWFLVATEPGTRFLFTRLGGILPGSFETGEINGPIRGPLEVQDLVYRTETMKVTIDRVLLDWDLLDLARRQLDVHRLHADGVRILMAAREQVEEEQGPLPDVNLRFNVIVRDARVTDLAITTPGAAEPFVVDSIALDTRSEGDAVLVRSLAVRAPELTLDASGRVQPQGDYPVDLAVAWSAALPDLPRASGRARLSGTLERLTVGHDLEAPLAARLDAVLTTPLRDLAFDGTVRVPRVNPAEIDPEWPAAEIGGTVKARGTIEAFSGAGQLTADSPEYGEVAADVELAREGAAWRIGRLTLTTPGSPARLIARGTVSTGATGGAGEDGESAGPLRFDLAADWEDLAWPLVGTPAVRSRAGSVVTEGTLDGYDLELTADLAIPAAPSVPPGRWRLAGRGDQSGLDLESLRGALFGGQVAARGRVAWQPAVEWRLAVDGRGIDPGAVAPDWAGSLDVTARTEGRLADAGPVGRVEPFRVSGALRGEPVAGNGGLRFAGDRFTLSALDLTWGTARLAAAGDLGPRWDLGWELEVPNLGVALPESGGSLTGRGRITGPGDAPRVAATLSGQSLVYGGNAVTGLTADADVDLAPAGPIRLDVEATGVALGERRIERVTLAGSGTRGAHRLAATATGPENALSLALAGGLTGTTAWSGELAALDLRSEQAGAWSLAAPAPLAASAERVALGDLCWVSGGSRLCAAGAWAKTAGWNVDATLADLPFSLAQAFLPPDLEITGDLDGTVLARADAAGRLTADVDLTPGPGAIVYPGAEGEEVTVRYEQGTLTLDAGPAGVQGRLGLVLVDVGTIGGEVTLPDYNARGVPARDQVVSGALRANLSDLGVVAAFAPGVEQVAGRLDADLAVSGTVAAPRVTGTARLADGRAEIPRYGLELTEIRLDAVSDGSPVIRLDGGARSGPGTVALTGQATFAPSAETPVRLAIEGQRFAAMDTREMKVFVSPDVDLVYSGERLEVTGEVVIPEADLEIKEREQGAIAASRDVVIVAGAEETPEQRSDLPVHARLRLVLGDDISLKAFGLNASPEGSLLLIDEPGKPTQGIGEIEIDEGTFKAYGQDLTIERGRLIFGGPIANPGLDLRAFRRANDGVVAGIEARGTLEAPQVTLWSEPPMGQTDQLAYLLLGRPLERTEPAEGDLLANAATSLGLKGGNLLAKKLGARFGLKEARIETGATNDDASLVLGKYLSPRLYVAYGVGLFEPVNTFRIRYLLNEKLTLQAETGAATSADLLYTRERGD